MLKNMLSIKWRRSSILAIVMAIAIGISSCQQIMGSSSAQTNNQLVYSILSDPKTFNPVLSRESPNIFGYVLESLITENGKGIIEPALASSWQITPDNKTIIFTLKENLKWSDGHDLTIDDVLFSFNDVYFNPAIPSDERDAMKIGKDRKLPIVRKVDNQRVEFIIAEPFAPFLRTMGGMNILPAHTLRPTITQKDSKGKPVFLSTWGIDTPPSKLVSSGLFKLAAYVPGERLVFDRNPYYWRKDSQDKQQPYIERVVWQIVESQDTALIQFRSGGLDSYPVTPDFFSLLKKEEKKGKYTIYNGGAAPGTTFITFNLNQGERDGKSLVDPVRSRWFNHVKFRQAIAYGIDRQRMINNIYRGLGAPQDSPISVPSPYFLSRKEGLKNYDYNPQKAKQLFAELGFKYNEQNKLIDDRGNPVRFTLITNSGNKIRESIGTQIKQDLTLLGVDVDFTPIAWSLVTDKLSNSLSWDAIIVGFGGGVEPHDNINLWAVDGASHLFNAQPEPGKPPIQGRQIADWEKQIHELYIKGSQELDEKKRRDIYIEVQKITQENVPFIYLVNPLYLAAVKDKVKGVKFSPLSGAFWNMYELKIAAE
jgi:peptide/nickel transport system substrate-binding protein